MDRKESVCWLDGESCPYQSGVKCFLDASDMCQNCQRLFDYYETLQECVLNDAGYTLISDQDVGTIADYLRYLRELLGTLQASPVPDTDILGLHNLRIEDLKALIYKLE